MADKALNIVEEYAQADIEAKIELIIRYYPNFLKIVDLHERELQYIIKQEKAYNRRKAKGDLGVRVQTSGISNPTFDEADANLEMEKAFASGDIEEVIKELDEESYAAHSLEFETIQNMREDYDSFTGRFFYLDEDVEFFETYLSYGKHRTMQTADKLLEPEDTVRQRAYRCRKIVQEQTLAFLERKYSLV